MSKRDVAKSAVGKLLLDVLSNPYVNNEPESSSESSSPPMESQSHRLKLAQEDYLETVYLKNQFPTDEGYADIARKAKRSVQEIVFWFNQRREKENHNVKCYKRSLSESIQDTVMDVDLEVDSELDSEDSLTSLKKSDNRNTIGKTSRNESKVADDQDDVQTSKSSDDSPNLVKLETLLDPFLTVDGVIASYNDLPQILKIMSKRKNYLDKNYCIELLSNPRNSRQVMESIAKKMGLILLRVWLSSASKDENGRVLTEVILKLLKRLPTPAFEDLKESKIGNVVKSAGNSGTLEAKNLADFIQAKWLQDIKKHKESSVKVKSGTLPVTQQKQAAAKPVKPVASKSISPVIPSPATPQLEKKTVTAISFDIFKANPAASLPKIKKSDKPVIRKSPEASPTVTESPNLAHKEAADTQDSADNKVGAPKYSYRRSDVSDLENKRKMEQESEIPKKKRKTVRFKPADSLNEIRYYEPDSSEMYHGTREDNHNYDKEEFTFAKSQMLKEAKEWSPPQIYYFEDDTTYTWGESSKEKEIQNEREKKGFQSLYFKLEDIPDSPAEPDFEKVPTNQVKPIPYEEFYSQNQNSKSIAAPSIQLNQIPAVPNVGYLPNTFIPPGMPTNAMYLPNQAWQSQSQYQHLTQINPPRFVSQNNFYPGGQAQNVGYAGNSWGNQYQRPVCQNYRMGICTNGNQCPNLHSR